MENSTPEQGQRPSSASCLRIGTLKGAKMYLHWSYFALLAFNLSFSILLTDNVIRTTLYNFLLYGPMAFISIFIHEIGHIAATKKLGGEINEVILWPLGGLTFYGPTDFVGDLKVALAGPIMQIPLMIILGVLYVSLRTEDMSTFTAIFASYKDISGDIGLLFLTLCMTTFWYNAFIFIINVFIPIYPLDGVRIWTAMLKKSGASLTKAAKTVSFAGMFVSAWVFIFSVIDIVFYSLYGGGFFEVIFAAFGFVNSKNLYDKVKAGRLRDDPILGRDCYEHATDGIEMADDDTHISSDTNASSVARAETSEIV